MIGNVAYSTLIQNQLRLAGTLIILVNHKSLKEHYSKLVIVRTLCCLMIVFHDEFQSNSASDLPEVNLKVSQLIQFPETFFSELNTNH